MNETIGEFILREKVEEAKRLLMVSKHSLLDISVLLHFNDQSHFTKVFKQFVGLTPKNIEININLKAKGTIISTVPFLLILQ